MLFSRVFPEKRGTPSPLFFPTRRFCTYVGPLQYPGSNPGADRRFFNAVSDATASGDELTPTCLSGHLHITTLSFQHGRVYQG